MKWFGSHPGAGPEMVRKWSGTTNAVIFGLRRKWLLRSQLGCQGSIRCGSSPPGSSGFCRVVVARSCSLPTTGGRLPASIQKIQRSQVGAPGTPNCHCCDLSHRPCCSAIPLSFAHQERRTLAFMVRLQAPLYPSLSAYGHHERARRLASNLPRSMVFSSIAEEHVTDLSQGGDDSLPRRKCVAVVSLNGFLGRCSWRRLSFDPLTRIFSQRAVVFSACSLSFRSQAAMPVRSFIRVIGRPVWITHGIAVQFPPSFMEKATLKKGIPFRKEATAEPKNRPIESFREADVNVSV